jgi:subtilisin family serine protease
VIEKRPDEGEPDNIATAEWEGRQIRYYTDRVVVKLKAPEDSSKTFDDVYYDVVQDIPDGELQRPPSPSGRMVCRIAEEADPVEVASKLNERDDVEWAEPDVVDHAAVTPSDTRFGEQWGLTKMNAPAAWDLETGSPSVLIGIIDSGISMSAAGALDHPDLDASRYILGTDFVDGGTPRDLNGHGTHVAGIAAAESNNAQGVAGTNWGSKVYICRTLAANGNGSSADFADAVEEIVDFAVSQSMKAVINYSGGGAPNQTKRDACQYAHDRGMILCAATGNDNAGPVIFPAGYSVDFDGVIAVGSTDSNDTVSSFSNVGPEVTVVAPGRGILSTMPTYSVTIPAALNYDELDGTSMATPYVSGVVALMWSRHPGFTNTRIRECLTTTAVKLGSGDFNNSWGFGRVDAEKALRCGDLVFPPFTKFTFFTKFTLTPVTPFTKFTFHTPFTKFTFQTPFTLFTPITKFTPITIFTRFTPFTPEPGPGPDPFVRFRNTIFDPAELQLGLFDEYAPVADALAAAGVRGLHDLVIVDADQLGELLGIEAGEAGEMVAGAQNRLRAMTGPV